MEFLWLHGTQEPQNIDDLASEQKMALSNNARKFVIFAWLFALTSCSDFYSYSAKDIEGNEVSMDTFRGKVSKLWQARKRPCCLCLHGVSHRTQKRPKNEEH